MPDKGHETEAEKILARIGNQDDEIRLMLVAALEQAERRGREMSASLKESSG